MKRFAVLLGALVIAPSAMGVANASTALLLGGKGIYAELSEEQMVNAFGGYFADYDRRVNVPFPGKEFYSSVKVGTENLYNAVYDPQYAGPKTIGGVSEGAPAVMEVLRRLEADRLNTADGKEPPPPSELNVAIYGSPSDHWTGKLAGLPVPVTPYNIIIVTAQYDGIADFPDNPWNMLAVSNAIMGAAILHVKQSEFDIRNKDTYYTVQKNEAGGTTTTILIPTEVLPILQPMVAFHFDPDFVAKLDAKLRPKIDKAYHRPEMEYGIPDTLTGPPGPAPTVEPPPEQEQKSIETKATALSTERSTTSWKDAAAERRAERKRLRDEARAEKQAAKDDSDDAKSVTAPPKSDEKTETKDDDRGTTERADKPEHAAATSSASTGGDE
ncbi:PE-PPE domain-containing protein [Mycolicibacterium sp. 018/SC-01/001]|uniref:PE-PPE domain-containing protein n=1 Tax=Mycolicibacterium sp. 018/SC-01/001 TaxID=2592069 RepID=UPI00117E69A3|nr:PE-PPE domain-containing protein [Mycolicibacterium sp. 018/SC-01/001]TRW86175.1 PE-PPE domain-containing protein [Mycolicibacterium sp. 018/SC-01/001]